MRAADKFQAGLEFDKSEAVQICRLIWGHRDSKLRRGKELDPIDLPVCGGSLGAGQHGQQSRLSSSRYTGQVSARSISFAPGRSYASTRGSIGG
jgi:hypothetical protein